MEFRLVLIIILILILIVCCPSLPHQSSLRPLTADMFIQVRNQPTDSDPVPLSIEPAELQLTTLQQQLDNLQEQLN